MAQKDAELEFSYLSQLIQGNLEKYKSYDRVVVNYLKLDTIIEYFSRQLYSIKAKSPLRKARSYSPFFPCPGTSPGTSESGGVSCF